MKETADTHNYLQPALYLPEIETTNELPAWARNGLAK